MIEALRNLPMPTASQSSVPRTDPASPAQVLFLRRARSASVAATDRSVASRQVAFPSSGRASEGRCVAVHQVLRALRGVGAFVASTVASASSPVASASRSIAYPSARRDTPVGTIPLVLRSLRRRAAAAKVLRGRRRLQDAVVSSVCGQVASASGSRALHWAGSREAPVGSASESVSVACVSQRRVASSPVASTSVPFRSVEPGQSARFPSSPLRTSASMLQPRIVH